RVDEFDRKGLKIAVANKSAYDLWLTRNIKHAELMRLATSQVAIDEFVAGRADVAAGVRQPLQSAARTHANLRVIEGPFMTIAQASVVRKGGGAAAKYLREFIEEAKASGFVARKLQESGVADATVAPAAS